MKTTYPTCEKKLIAIEDAMYVIGGKWKMTIVAGLSYGPKRFSELLESIEGISGKMLSRTLKEMEINLLVKRTVSETRPISVEYELTDYARDLCVIIDQIAEWGSKHRQKIIDSNT